MPRLASSIALALTSLLTLACGAAASSPRSTTPVARDIAGATPLHGPYASWDEICGAPRTLEDGQDPATASERRERCDVHVSTLAAGGPFLEMATYSEGGPMSGSTYLALRTERGWFVTEIPDGEPFGGGLSHHSPASLEHDVAATRFEDGVLRVIARGSQSSFVPGRGPLGSTSATWTSVEECGVREGVVVCAAPRELHREDCHVDESGERSCVQHGDDVPRG